MAVPYTFATATSAIPLSQLDSNFATAVTIGNVAIQLGNTATTLGNVTMANVTITSVSTPITAAQGGTGLTSITSNNVILGNGTSSVQIVAPGTTGNVLTSTGSTWVSQAGASQATATALGTVYAKQTTGGGTPYLTAFGYNAGVSTTGNSVTAIGTEALFTNSTAVNSTAVGYQALYFNNANSNTAVGLGASYTNSSGAENCSFGVQALYGNTLGSYNTAIGKQAGYGNVSGNYNTYIGYQAGYTGTGSNNVVVCNYYCLAAAVGDSSYIHIASVSASVAKGSSTGYINPNGGGVYQGNNSAAWSVASDQRLKKNIVNNDVGLDKVIQIQVRNFEYRTEDEVTDLPKNQAIAKQGVQLGVIAQELQQILPDCVKQESTGVMAVEHDNIMWHMINAIKELNAEITALKAKVGI